MNSRLPEISVWHFFMIVVGGPILGLFVGLGTKMIFRAGWNVAGILALLLLTAYVVFGSWLTFSLSSEAECPGQWRGVLGPGAGLILGYFVAVVVVVA